ncbi:MAG: hypothetical protein QM704_05845 [Anaeromyxobacteraceae bacterium]
MRDPDLYEPSDMPDGPEPTAQPTERPMGDLMDEDVVPRENVGGAAPTPRGGDSGGDLPGAEDDSASLAEEEPPRPPELDAVHVKDG